MDYTACFTSAGGLEVEWESIDGKAPNTVSGCAYYMPWFQVKWATGRNTAIQARSDISAQTLLKT